MMFGFLGPSRFKYSNPNHLPSQSFHSSQSHSSQSFHSAQSHSSQSQSSQSSTPMSYYMKNKQVLKERAKESRMRNKEAIKVRNRAYRLRNAAAIKEALRGYYVRNRAARVAQARAYADAHPELVRVRERAYRERNRERISARSMAYYALHRPHLQQRRRSAYAQTRALSSEQSRRYHHLHREATSARQRAYYAQNQQRIKEKAKEYYQSKRRALGGRRARRPGPGAAERRKGRAWSAGEALRWVGRAQRELEIKAPEDWYRVSHLQVALAGGRGAVRTFGSLAEVLGMAHPEAEWVVGRFGVRAKKATQRWLCVVVRTVLPAGTEVVEEYMHPELLWEEGKEHKMELDVWVPQYKLAFEYQGEQHYFDFCGKGTLEGCKERDSKKMEQCVQKGITLIHIPYWWDRRGESLLSIIKNVRPDIFGPLLLS
eukprot:TRINITY_DN7039_c0_g2_i2.p1 TRINITY_DN7039_c0_g2~~TRINITY_DN7039_c0_g2_i2.p1  ORF type:complete len:429 (-),score=73.05 TRINITY_DN7039_c0_g2_i2:180-1466(-)